ncbi:MAG: PRTRC system ThiF family protein [Syntrophorhabdales bacterium]|jgi:PRTRC genetic system ThiF family protein
MSVLKHYVHPSLVVGREPVQVTLIGAGGTGSQLLSGLARMHQALKALGSPGLHVRVFDGDTVSASNVGRQLFSPSDIGKNKAVVLVTRINLFFGTVWEADPYYVAKDTRLPGRMVLSAVDDVKSRSLIGQLARESGTIYWLDTGNTSSTGQVILGTLTKVAQPEKSCPSYLPHVLDLYKGIMEEESEKLYQGPSCSVPESLARQDLFVNQWVATCALEIIWKIFRQGQLMVHGAFVNLSTMSVRPLPVNPAVWEAMGWKPRKRKKREAYRKAA